MQLWSWYWRWPEIFRVGLSQFSRIWHNPMPHKKTIIAEGVAMITFRKLYTRFGLFNKIISDQGPQFAAWFQKELGRILGYELALSSAYYPQTDGVTERVNQEVKTYLWIFCGSNPSEWAEQIPMAEFVHNIQPHSTTSKSPFYLMMGYEPQALPNITNKTDLPAVEKWLDELVKARNEASAAHKLARQTMKSRIQSKFTSFITGDKVWLEARNLKRNIINPKFTAKREGPFKVTKVLSSLSYQLEILKSWRIHLVFHASLLTPYKENDIHGPNYPQPPPVMSLVSWYDPIPFHFCIFSIFALTLTYYDAGNRCDASHELHESTRSRARSMLNFH